MSDSYFTLVHTKVVLHKKNSLVKIPMDFASVYVPETDETFWFSEYERHTIFRKTNDCKLTKKHFHLFKDSKLFALWLKRGKDEEGDFYQDCHYAIAKRDIFFIEYTTVLNPTINIRNVTEDHMEDLQYDLENSDIVKSVYNDIKDKLYNKDKKYEGSIKKDIVLLFDFWASWDSYAGDGDAGVNYAGLFDYGKFETDFQKDCRKYIIGTDYIQQEKNAMDEYMKTEFDGWNRFLGEDLKDNEL